MSIPTKYTQTHCVLAAMVFLGAASASAQAPFTEEAIARGVIHVNANNEEQLGNGIGLIDLDGDGDPDLVAVGGGSGGRISVLENDGTGNFIDRTATSKIPNQPLPSAVCAADYDADGDLDLFITNFLSPDRLYRNDGNFTFTDVTAIAGVGSSGAGLAAVWGDIDNDGWPDLYVANRTGTEANPILNHLWHNQGDGTFVDIGATLMVVDGTAPTLVATFIDYDRDADADIYIGNDKGNSPQWENHLYRNDGDMNFSDVTTFSGTAADVHCMGIGIGDCDHNGWQDLYVTNIPEGNKLLMANGDGTFTDATIAAGVGSYVVGWGAAFFDYDNDRTEDLYVCGMLGPNRLYTFSGGFPCTDLAPALGVADPNTSYACALGDIDNDGDLDLVVEVAGQNLKVFINHEGQKRNWIKLRVVGQGANTHGIGAQVDLLSGGLWQMREVLAGNNYKSQNDLVLHFGMGDATAAEQVVVVWPGGATRTLFNLDVNREWILYPPERLGDMNCDGIITPGDIAPFVLALTNPGGYAAQFPNCQLDLADFTNDGVVTPGDIAGFVASLTGS